MYLTIIQNLYLTKQDRTKIKLCKVCRGPNTDHYILTFSHISETRVEEGIGETEGERERERERKRERETITVRISSLTSVNATAIRWDRLIGKV